MYYRTCTCINIVLHKSVLPKNCATYSNIYIIYAIVTVFGLSSKPVATHNGGHDKALEQEALATVAVALKDEEVSVSCHLASH